MKATISFHKLFKQYSLPLGMLLGILFHSVLSDFTSLSPYLISLVLLLTFTKLSPKELHFSKSQFLLLAFQAVGAIAIYYALAPFNKIVAEGAMICILVPTATAAPVIVNLLGGNVGYVTTYLFLCNSVMAVLFPLYISMINSGNDISFWGMFTMIVSKVALLLFTPLIIAWCLRFFAPKVHNIVATKSHWSLYVWSAALMIATASTINFFLSNQDSELSLLIYLIIVAIVLSLVQIVIGKKIGSYTNNVIGAGQALGQKNTVFAIWTVQTFMHPVASLAPAAYIVSQNIINSYQVWHKNRRNND